MLAEIAPLLEQLDGRSLRVLERQHLADAGNGIATLFALDAMLAKLAAQIRKILARRNFEGDFRAGRLWTGFQLHTEQAGLGNEIRLALFTLAEDEPIHLRVIVNGAIEVGRFERGVTNSSGLDHGCGR